MLIDTTRDYEKILISKTVVFVPIVYFPGTELGRPTDTYINGRSDAQSHCDAGRENCRTGHYS